MSLPARIFMQGWKVQYLPVVESSQQELPLWLQLQNILREAPCHHLLPPELCPRESRTVPGEACPTSTSTICVSSLTAICSRRQRCHCSTLSLQHCALWLELSLDSGSQQTHDQMSPGSTQLHYGGDQLLTNQDFI